MDSISKEYLPQPFSIWKVFLIAWIAVLVGLTLFILSQIKYGHLELLMASAGIALLMCVIVLVLVAKFFQRSISRRRLVLSESGILLSGSDYRHELFWNDIASVYERRSRKGKLLLIEIKATNGRQLLLSRFEGMDEISNQIHTQLMPNQQYVKHSSYLKSTRIFAYISFAYFVGLVILGYQFGTLSPIFKNFLHVYLICVGLFLVYPRTSTLFSEHKFIKIIGWLLVILGILALIIQ